MMMTWRSHGDPTDRKGVTHKPTTFAASVHLSKGRTDEETLASVSNDLAATFAALEMVLDELSNHPSLRVLRVDLNVVAPPTMPFDKSARRFVDRKHKSIMESVGNITAAFVRLLDQQTSLKNVKIGLDPALAACVDAEQLTNRRERTNQRRMAVLSSRHARMGADSTLAMLPEGVLAAVLDAALPMDQTVEVLPLRK